MGASFPTLLDLQYIIPDKAIFPAHVSVHSERFLMTALACATASPPGSGDCLGVLLVRFSFAPISIFSPWRDCLFFPALKIWLPLFYAGQHSAALRFSTVAAPPQK